MGALLNLEGTSRKSIDCMFINKGSDIEVVLNNGYAATSANTSGAINIWKDDEGNIRCEAMANFRKLDKKIFKSFYPAIKWADKWLLKIK